MTDSNDMTPTEMRAAMRDAHVAYELRRYQGENLKATVVEEVSQLWQWLAPRKVNTLVSPAAITAWVHRAAAAELPEAMRDLVRENIAVAVETLQEDSTRVEEVLPRTAYDQLVASFAGLVSLRQEIVHQFVTSSVYSMLVSDVLYRGIKGYVLTDNALARNIPGASSFVKLSQSALNAAAPQFEKNVDKQLTAFINANIQNTIQESEKFLNKAMDAQVIGKMADEIWDANATRQVSTLSSYFDAGSRQALLDAIEAVWRQFRQTGLFAELVDGAVRTFFLRYGKQDVGAVLHAMGYTQVQLAEEVYSLAQPLVALALEDGYLEARIRTRLDGFYASYFADGADGA